jgi:uncharacterized protein (DUF1015 family)
MASLFPFRPLRPLPAAAARVAAVPYDVVSVDEARALAHDPLSFLHVSRPEIDLPRGADPYADATYEKAAQNFEALAATGPLVRESAPSLYAYRLETDGHVQTGVAGCFSVAEYDQGVVMRHELTRPDKEDDRTRHILRLRSQTGPVFLLHPAAPAVEAALTRVADCPPLFDFTAVDGVRHTVWRVADAEAAVLVAAFAAMPALYIADGHHRAASASRVNQTLGASGVSGEWDRFLGVAFSEREARILPYNRVVLDLGGRTPASVLDAMRARCGVEPGPASPRRRGEAAMFLDGRWYTCTLGAAPAGSSAADRLDVSLLQAAVLGPVFGIGDVRTDPRIAFVGGARGTAALEEMVTSGRAAAAFSLFPVAVADLMMISDEGGIMPPKSTWFEPKLRDGLLLHTF